MSITQSIFQSRPSLVRGAVASALAAAALCTSVQASAANMNVLVVNESSHIVETIRVAPIWEQSFGFGDALGARLIGSGGSAWVNFNTNDGEGSCLLDVVALSADGERWSTRMNVCQQSQWVLYN